MESRISLSRLQRAVWLSAEPLGYGDAFLISGGADTHVATLGGCNCRFWEITAGRDGPCSHILKVGLCVGEPTVLLALRELVEMPSQLRLLRSRAA